MKATNKQIVDAVVNEMPQEMSENLKGTYGAELLTILTNYPAKANSFITTLTNKVTKSLIYSKIYTNQLKELKKGKLAYGDSIEELFVQMAQVKGFTENWDTQNNANTPEADLIRKLVPKVSALYIQLNVDYKSKTTVMDKQMRKAFLNEGGLSNLVQQIVGSITSAMEFKEFNLTKTVINALISEGKQVTSIGANGSITTGNINSSSNAPIKQTPYVVNTGGEIRNLSQEIREAVGLMQFPSDKFNLAKELTWSRPNELMLLTTPKVIAELDTQVLASAFNMSKADLVTRTILVDEMPNGAFKAGSTNHTPKHPTDVTSTNSPQPSTDIKPKAILFDSDMVQIWDTHQGAGTFHNPEGEYTNHFANREGIFATCLFANMAVFY